MKYLLFWSRLLLRVDILAISDLDVTGSTVGLQCVPLTRELYNDHTWLYTLLIRFAFFGQFLWCMIYWGKHTFGSYPFRYLCLSSNHQLIPLPSSLLTHFTPPPPYRFPIRQRKTPLFPQDFNTSTNMYRDSCDFWWPNM